MAPEIALLRLPVEIRAIIFNLSLAIDGESMRTSTPPLIVALRSTIQKTSLYDEALETYYNGKGYHFKINSSNFESIEELVPSTKLMIRHLVLDFKTAAKPHRRYESFVQSNGINIQHSRGSDYEKFKRICALRRIVPRPSLGLLNDFIRVQHLFIKALDVPHYTFITDLSHEQRLTLERVKLVNTYSNRLSCRFFTIEALIKQSLCECKDLQSLTVTVGEHVLFNTSWTRNEDGFLPLDNESWIGEINRITGVKGKLLNVTDPSLLELEQEALDHGGFENGVWQVREHGVFRENAKVRIDWIWKAAEGTTLARE